MVRPVRPVRPVRLVLIGDGESPHLLKWARALAATGDVELWAASSRGFLAGFDAVLPGQRRLALAAPVGHGGGNVQILRKLPTLARWLQRIDADWLHAHYLTSHGTLAWLARRGWRLRARLVGSAWGSDILVTPARSAAYRWLTTRVLRACSLTTSDSAHMAQRMHELGAGEVMTFPFGLEAMPAPQGHKDPWLFYANRGLEPIYAPQRVLDTFAAIARVRPEARLVVANDGSLAGELVRAAGSLGLTVSSDVDAPGTQVAFVGRLGAAEQARWYGRAQWYLSLPQSDSVAVSVIEAMAHGAIPLLSDLPANRELVRDGDNGLIVPDGALPGIAALDALRSRGAAVAEANRAWVAAHALFAPAVQRFVERLRAIEAGR